MASIWKMCSDICLRTFICSRKLSVNFEVQIIPKDKYLSLVIKSNGSFCHFKGYIFVATRTIILKFGNITRILNPQLVYIQSRDSFRQSACEQKYSMDFNYIYLIKIFELHSDFLMQSTSKY